MHAALASAELLWPGGDVRAPCVALGSELRRTLTRAHAAARVTRGLELVERQLDAEARGMASADRRSGASRGERVSRLMLVTCDAAERLCRRVESICRRHAGRVVVLRVDCDGDELGGLLYGPGSTAKLLMVDHKEAVAETLLVVADAAG